MNTAVHFLLTYRVQYSSSEIAMLNLLVYFAASADRTGGISSVVTMPRARTAASADSAILDVPQASSVKYLFIPAALSDDVEERILTVPEGKEVECLTDTLKGHFSAVGGDGGGASSVMIEAIKAQLAAKHGADAAAQVDPALLAQFAGQQMVEITSIQPGTKANGFCSTNMYSDDQGVAKQLPVNQRASAMCQACGKELQVTGDVFLSRVYDDGDEFRRLDFTSDEMSSSAPWVKLAQEHHRANPPAPAGAPTMMNSGDPDELRRLAGSMGSGSPGFVAPAPSPQPSPLEKKKAEGNRWFKKKKFKLAIGAYTEAIAMAEQELQTKAVLHGNRAACHACMEVRA